MNESNREATTLKERLRMVEDVAEILKDVGIFEAAYILGSAAGALNPGGMHRIGVVIKHQFPDR